VRKIVFVILVTVVMMPGHGCDDALLHPGAGDEICAGSPNAHTTRSPQAACRRPDVCAKDDGLKKCNVSTRCFGKSLYHATGSKCNRHPQSHADDHSEPNAHPDTNGYDYAELHAYSNTRPDTDDYSCTNSHAQPDPYSEHACDRAHNGCTHRSGMAGIAAAAACREHAQSGGRGDGRHR
jgi:hypothetical protein